MFFKTREERLTLLSTHTYHTHTYTGCPAKILLLLQYQKRFSRFFFTNSFYLFIHCSSFRLTRTRSVLLNNCDHI